MPANSFDVVLPACKVQKQPLDSLFDELGKTEEVELLTQKKRVAAKIGGAMVRKRMTHPFPSGAPWFREAD